MLSSYPAGSGFVCWIPVLKFAEALRVGDDVEILTGALVGPDDGSGVTGAAVGELDTGAAVGEAEGDFVGLPVVGT